MLTSELVWALSALEIAAAGVTLLLLLRVVAPYGRHTRPGWGPSLPARWGWVVMELPTVVVFAAVFALGPGAGVAPLLLALWMLHYGNRTFIYPLRMRATGKRMPVAIALLGAAFNTLNATANAGWVGHVGHYPAEWLTDPRFLIGAAVFLSGVTINVHSDEVLRRLRAPGEQGYKVPMGGLHRWVASPNYLGEIIAWCGWAVLTWSPAGLAFALYTAANLVPRADANWRWARENLPEYPRGRRRLLPGLW